MPAAPETQLDGDAEAEHLEPIEDERDRALGRYRLSYQIASGGMATVYLGRVLGAAGFNRPVAIKRIHPHLAKRPELVAMFLDEARIASRIDHPNVCTLFDFGEVSGSYFMAMEYLVGVPLTRLIAAAGRRPSLHESARYRAFAARIVADAAEGLHAAHELVDESGQSLGVVHRDVSPQNIFVTFDGAVKVVDFGIALARDRLQETHTGTLKGKFGYMAPEHAGGGRIDRRADVWGLGVVLWEMLTAERLFKRGNDMETILAIRSGDIPAPSSRVPGIPEALEAIVLRALSVSPDDRYPTARAMGRDLTELIRAEGAAVGLADLAELMESIFHDEKSEKIDVVRTVLHEAERGGVDALPTLPLAAAGAERFGSDTASMPSPDGTRSGVTVKEPVVLTRETAAPDRGTLVKWWTAVALLALILGAAVGLATMAREPPRVPEREDDDADAPALAVTEPEPVTSQPEAVEPAADAAVAPDAGPPSRRARKARPVSYGHAHVVTVGGWADVYVGSRRVGRSPMRVRLPAGRRVITVRPFGDGPPRRVTAEVPADGVVPVVVQLGPR